MVPTVVIDLADDARFARDIVAGGVFVPGCALTLDADCALVVRGPFEEVELRARVVFVDPATGAGLELVGYSPALRAHLTLLLDGWCATLAAAGDAPIDPPATVDANTAAAHTAAGAGADTAGADTAGADTAAGADSEMGTDTAADGRVSTAAADAPATADAATTQGDARGEAGAAADAAAEALAADTAEATDTGDTADTADATDAAAADALVRDDADAEPDPERRRLARNYYERLRGLTVAQQIKAAHSPDPQERIILERLYNKTVWEPLLRNPRLTPPEVARIARMGTVPRILLEVIVANGAWLQMPEVRRALLGNPRLGTDQIVRVLRLLPKHELKLAAVQTAYPHAVRDAARRLLKA